MSRQRGSGWEIRTASDPDYTGVTAPHHSPWLCDAEYPHSPTLRTRTIALPPLPSSTLTRHHFSILNQVGIYVLYSLGDGITCVLPLIQPESNKAEIWPCAQKKANPCFRELYHVWNFRCLRYFDFLSCSWVLRFLWPLPFLIMALRTLPPHPTPWLL